jgi:galactose mutarotase-like enzyme
MAAPDAMNTGEDLYRLAPGKSLKTWVKYIVKPV